MDQSGVNSSAGPARRRYVTGQQDRQPYLDRARDNSKLTIPSLFREDGANGTSSTVLPWTSIGAYGVNNLAAKLTLTLFPPGIPFIQFKPGKAFLRDLEAIDEMDRGVLKAEVDKGLSYVEREFSEGVEEDGDRATLFDAFRHLIVGGNHAIAFKKQMLQSIALDNYVTWRDNSGRLLEFVIDDPMSWESLPADIQQMCQAHGYKVEPDGADGNPALQQPISVYTHGTWKRGKWKGYQECYGQVVPGSEWTYDEVALPYQFLRFIAQKRENYGRSYCEDYEADLQTMDALWQMLTEGGMSIAQMKTLIKPGGSTNKKAYEEAPNGAILTGDPEDVNVVRSEKGGDLAFVVQIADKVEARLMRVFVVTTVRQGERVTAEEIKLMARELEGTLGGVYANQVTTFQKPYATLKLADLQRQDRVTKLPKNSVKVSILTGDAALGRMQRANTLDEFLGTSGAVITALGPAAPYISISNYLSRGAANRGVDTDGLIKSEEDVQEMQAQAMQQQTLASVAPEIVKQGGQMIQNEQTAQQQQPEGV